MKPIIPSLTALIVACFTVHAAGQNEFVVLANEAGFTPSPRAAPGERMILAAAGKPACGVFIAAELTEPTQLEVKRFCAVLSKMVGQDFEMKRGAPAKGIIIGLTLDFPEEATDKRLQRGPETARENYVLKSAQGRLLILGNTEAAIEHALWDVAHRLGYHQYFPGSAWEVIPRREEVSLAVDNIESPAFHGRKIWYGYGALPENQADYQKWCVRNRATMGIDLRTGHAYEGIFARHKNAFDAHPEYLALVGGKRQPPKFCTANKDLRRLVVDDALDQLARNPKLDSVSCDPSDGGGWCECAQCAQLGSVSDRALFLANEVARAVQAKYPGKLVGMYAYNEHSPVPAIMAEPNVVISVATGFIKGGATLDQLLEGWSRRVQTLGIREYYSVHPWDRDLPGEARGASLDYLGETIPQFHAKQARFLSAEASDNWGCNGLGYYFAARLLWDPREAALKEAVVRGFIDDCFAEARVPMTKFYRLLNGSGKLVLSDDLLGQMYRLLNEARSLTKEQGADARLSDLVLYTRYVELWLDYSSAQGGARQKAFEELFRHAWRIRRTMMVHTLGLWRDLPHRDKTVTIPKDCGYQIPEGMNPWKSSQSFAAEELDQMIRAGIEARKLLDFAPVAFSNTLMPSTRLALAEVKEGTAGLYSRGIRNYFTWVEHPPQLLQLTAKGGVIYQNNGSASVSLYPAAEAELKSVAHVEVAPDREEHKVALATSYHGLHRIEVSDQTAGTTVTWPAGMPMTIVSSQESPAALYGRWTLYFYVPKGTRKVAGFAEGEGWLVDGGGTRVYEFGRKPGYFSVPVAEGQDGRLWRFEHSSGKRTLMTVPPCLARSARELLLPVEVVEKDAQ